MTRSPRRSRRLTAVIAVIGVLCGIVGGTAAYAVWSMRLTATGSVAAGSVSVAAYPMTGSAFINSSLTSTSIALTSNTSPQTSTMPAQIAPTFSATPATGLAANAGLAVWPIASVGDCTDTTPQPAGATTGTWGVGLTVPAASLSPGDSQMYCVRTSFATRQQMASASGSQSFSGSMGATLTVNSFTATAAPPAVMFNTLDVYPYATTSNFWYNVIPTTQSTCMDVTGGVNAAAGALIGTWSCHGLYTAAYANQWFTMTEVATNTVMLRIGGTNDRAMQANANGTVTTQVRNPGIATQLWEPQQVSPNVFLLVSASTGLCITAASTSTALSMSPCSNSPLQRFTFNQLAVAPPSPMSSEPGEEEEPIPTDAPTPTDEPTPTALAPSTLPGSPSAGLTAIEPAGYARRETSVAGDWR